MQIKLASRVEEARQNRGEDRIAIVDFTDRKLIAVVDGAGGVAGGATAANAIVRALIDFETGDCSTWLRTQDLALAAKGTGLAAAVALSISADGEIHGTSVGDCEAWIFGQGEAVNLTAGQVRKPLLGDGSTIPTSFTARLTHGRLIVASDGLWKYLSHSRIAAASLVESLDASISDLVDGVDGVRLRSRALPDDVAIVMCEMN